MKSPGLRKERANDEIFIVNNLRLRTFARLRYGTSYRRAEGYQVFDEGELGNRYFFGERIDSFDEDGCTDIFTPPQIRDKNKAEIAAIAKANGLKPPEYWTIGAID